VQSADDLQRVRACISGGHRPLFMAKIEKRRALSNLEAIIEAADGVMVARGDLGVETDLAEIPLAQKRIIAAANARARPVVTATQMLESMVEHEHPTRAEVTDVANAVLDGTDAVMLSAESAVGRHPAAAVRILQRVLAATEAEYATRLAAARLERRESVGADEAVPFAACQLAQRVGAKAIIARATDHGTPSAIARFRPALPVVALSPSPALCRSLTMISGVSPLHVAADASEASQIASARDWLLEFGLAKPGDPVIVLSATADATSAADTLQVVVLRH
jgi:pyruvate kinase